MKITFLATLITIISVLLSSSVFGADLRYNPHNGEWTYTDPGDVMKYNPHSSSWDYESPSSTMHYNPHSGTWSYED
ncbi:MAG: hypothetical protein CMJ11_06245 [Pelagibacterales bacterium]|nr:hypothetical protein [Pelagibacterales bacterium]|tara:strand:+ start:2199 stop:2426 length:228 start_codon:yes stop_codon:yes gene_type:complete